MDRLRMVRGEVRVPDAGKMAESGPSKVRPRGRDQATGTEARVIADIIRRQKEGIEKYGCTVEENPLTLREWLNHAYEEALDLAVYLRRAIEQLDSDEHERLESNNRPDGADVD